MGSSSIYVIVNVMSSHSITMTKIWSALGYSLLPMIFLALLNFTLDSKSRVYYILTVLAVIWSTLSASRSLVNSLKLENQQYLLAYPVFLFYSCFALLTIY